MKTFALVSIAFFIGSAIAETPKVINLNCEEFVMRTPINGEKDSNQAAIALLRNGGSLTAFTEIANDLNMKTTDGCYKRLGEVENGSTTHLRPILSGPSICVYEAVDYGFVCNKD